MAALVLKTRCRDERQAGALPVTTANFMNKLRANRRITIGDKGWLNPDYGDAALREKEASRRKRKQKEAQRRKHKRPIQSLSVNRPWKPKGTTTEENLAAYCKKHVAAPSQPVRKKIVQEMMVDGVLMKVLI